MNGKGRVAGNLSSLKRSPSTCRLIWNAIGWTTGVEEGNSVSANPDSASSSSSGDGLWQ